MRRVLKWMAIALASGLALVVVAVVVLQFMGRSRLNKTFMVTGLLAEAPGDSATISRGKHLVDTHACRTCHGQDLGGSVFVDVPPFRMVASNLTGGQGGIGGAFSIQDWDRAIRHGVRPTGKSLIIMPSRLFHELSDADLAAMVSYLKSVPAVDKQLEPSQVRFLGFAMLAMAGAEELEPILTASPKVSAPYGPTVEYGKYLASHSCVLCHGAGLAGGKSPDRSAPAAPPLLPSGYWPLADFRTALRTGVLPGGKTLSEFMPWKDVYEHLDDVEIEALHLYIRSLSPAGT